MLLNDLMNLILGKDLSPPINSRKPPVLSREDPPETVDDVAAPEPPLQESRPNLDVEGVSVVMEYESASGEFSRRRITMNRIERGAAAPLLMAYCHERRAPRKFRVDRISDFIDSEGEVVSPDQYWASIGVYLGDIEIESATPRSPGLGVQQRRLIRSQIYLLVALARSDGRLADRELSAILDYVEASCHAKSIPCSIKDLDALGDWLAQIFPTEHQIQMAIGRIPHIGQTATPLFWKAIERVATADGVLDLAETNFLLELREAIERIERDSVPAIQIRGEGP